MYKFQKYPHINQLFLLPMFFLRLWKSFCQRHLPQRLCALEGGLQCVLVPSGLAAIANVALALLQLAGSLIAMAGVPHFRFSRWSGRCRRWCWPFSFSFFTLGSLGWVNGLHPIMPYFFNKSKIYFMDDFINNRKVTK